MWYSRNPLVLIVIACAYVILSSCTQPTAGHSSAKVQVDAQEPTEACRNLEESLNLLISHSGGRLSRSDFGALEPHSEHAKPSCIVALWNRQEQARYSWSSHGGACTVSSSSDDIPATTLALRAILNTQPDRFQSRGGSIPEPWDCGVTYYSGCSNAIAEENLRFLNLVQCAD